MKIKVFNRSKYIESLRKLEARKAPSYIVEAFKYGFIEEVNQYYNIRKARLLNKNLISEDTKLLNDAKEIDVGFIQEATKKKDLDFLKAFFQMTNMNIFTGKKLPPDAAKLLKPEYVKDLGLKELYKKMR